MNTPKDILLLLSTLDSPAGLQGMLARGYEYFQVSKLIQDAMVAGWVRLEDTGVTTTVQGKEILRSARMRGSPVYGSTAWIAPMSEARQPRLPLDAEYIPPLDWSVG